MSSKMVSASRVNSTVSDCGTSLSSSFIRSLVNRMSPTSPPALVDIAPKPSVTTSSSASSSSAAKRFTFSNLPLSAGPVSVTVPAASDAEPNAWAEAASSASVKSVPRVPPANTSGTVTVSPAASARCGRR